MAMDRNHLFLVVLAFFIVLLTFHPKRHCTSIFVDLLETSTVICYIPMVVVVTWMRRFPPWFW